MAQVDTADERDPHRSTGRPPLNGAPSVPKKYELSYIRPQHREIARRLILGQTASDIARDLRMSKERVHQVINAPLFKAELKRLEDRREKGLEEVTNSLKEVATVALEQVERLMYNAKSETVQLKAAESLLDRAGHGAINRSQLQVQGNLNVNHSSMTDDELRQIVLNCLKRVETSHHNFQAQLEHASAIEVEFDEVDTRSTDEQKSIKILSA